MNGSRPSWARELKLAIAIWLVRKGWSRPSWARELKQTEYKSYRPPILSRPSWARELKQRCMIDSIINAVAPFVGA